MVRQPLPLEKRGTISWEDTSLAEGANQSCHIALWWGWWQWRSVSPQGRGTLCWQEKESVMRGWDEEYISTTSHQDACSMNNEISVCFSFLIIFPSSSYFVEKNPQKPRILLTSRAMNSSSIISGGICRSRSIVSYSVGHSAKISDFPSVCLNKTNATLNITFMPEMLESSVKCSCFGKMISKKWVFFIWNTLRCWKCLTFTEKHVPYT